MSTVTLTKKPARAATQAPDTPRRHLLTLARRQLSFPNMSVVDEVAAVSAVADPVRRDEVFTALCEAVRDGDAAGQAYALGVLLAEELAKEKGAQS